MGLNKFADASFLNCGLRGRKPSSRAFCGSHKKADVCHKCGSNSECWARVKKKDKVVIFSDSVNVINVKVCIAVVLNKFGQRVPFQRPWPHFKVIAALQS